MTIKIGITGGIGSGKSVVSRLLELLDIPVYVADTESKRLTNADPVIRRELCELLGEEVYQGGELNKPLLASYLFASPQQAAQVNGIIHPRVKQDFRAWAERLNRLPVVGMEAAILIECGFADEVDMVVMVYAPVELRLQRAMQRDNATREQVMQRMHSQMSDEEKCAQAGFIIVNDGKTPLIPQVLMLISSLSENNSYLCRAK